MQIDRDLTAASEPFESLPETILPAQIELSGRFGVAVGERRLLWAMLLDAATCFYKHRDARNNNGRKLFREAERWIRARDDNGPFSFQAVCDVLGLNAQSVRVSLLECVYGEQLTSSRAAGDGRRAGERGPRQLRHASGSRSGGNGGRARVRAYGSRVGERGDLLARALSGRV
jgi:hypothetical protein